MPYRHVLLVCSESSELAPLVHRQLVNEVGTHAKIESTPSLSTAYAKAATAPPDFMLLELDGIATVATVDQKLLASLCERVPILAYAEPGSVEARVRAAELGVRVIIDSQVLRSGEELLPFLHQLEERGSRQVGNAASAPQHGRGPTRILHVEDDAAAHILVRQALVSGLEEPFRLCWVERASTAIEKLEREGTDLVLLDMRLPDGFGTELIERIQAAAGDAPVVVVSGRYDDELATDAMRSGTQDYITKTELSLPGLLGRTIRCAVARAEATVRKREQSAIAREALRSLDDLPVGVFRSNPRGELFQTNKRFRTWFSGATDRTLDRRRFGALLEAQPPNVASRWRTALKEHQAYRATVHVPGSRHTTQLLVEALPQFEDGQFLGHLGTVTDLSAVMDPRMVQGALQALEPTLDPAHQNGA